MRLDKRPILIAASAVLLLLAGAAWLVLSLAPRLWPPSPAQPVIPSGYHQVFFDDFSGVWLNRANWAPVPLNHNNDPRPNPALVTVKNGHLVLEARRAGKVIQTGMVWSRGPTNETATHLKAFGVGHYIEARMKVASPSGVGRHTGFWMMPLDPAIASDGKWPNGGELDIAEVLGKDSHVSMMTTHFGPGDERVKSQYQYAGRYRHGEDLSTRFHTYGLKWLPDRFEYYFDGQLKHTAMRRGDTHPFNRPFFIFMTMACSLDPKAWEGSMPAGAIMPRAEVDWVSVSKVSNAPR